METDEPLALRYPLKMLQKWTENALEKAGLSQAALARAMTQLLGRSIDRAAVNKMIKGTRAISADELYAISKITGAILPEKPQTASINLKYFQQPQHDYIENDEKKPRKLTIRGDVQTGIWRDHQTYKNSIEFLALSIGHSDMYPIDSQYGLYVRDKSLINIADIDDILRCIDINVANITPADGDLAIIKNTRLNGLLIEISAKRLRFDNGKIYCDPESDDPRWQPYALRESEDANGIKSEVIAIVDFIIRPPNKNFRKS